MNQALSLTNIWISGMWLPNGPYSLLFLIAYSHTYIVIWDVYILYTFAPLTMSFINLHFQLYEYNRQSWQNHASSGSVLDRTLWGQGWPDTGTTQQCSHLQWGLEHLQRWTCKAENELHVHVHCKTIMISFFTEIYIPYFFWIFGPSNH